ncbi:MAG: OsmC family protein [Bacteroidota bacterium]
MSKQHHYQVSVRWTGNTGSGTAGYTAYERSHTVSAADKPHILCSSDPSFRGDKSKYNPEELLVASLSSCHMLWFLHLCADAGITVVEYSDSAQGTMAEDPDGGGRFTEVTLHPLVRIREAELIPKAHALHQRAHELCFIARSCNFPVRHMPVVSGL